MDASVNLHANPLLSCVIVAANYSTWKSCQATIQGGTLRPCDKNKNVA
jgi:hypothetical protein